MSKKKTRGPAAKVKPQDENSIEFVLDDVSPLSSAAMLRSDAGLAAVENTLVNHDLDLKPQMIPASAAGKEPIGETLSPAFKELAVPRLPELSRENRAKLLLQSPNRLFFYWSVGSNPFQTLNRALGSETGSYTLVSKLIDLKRDVEKIHPVDAEGSWWFDVEADTDYRAEIGFYAPNRPYVRVMFSNEIQTPRKSPSPRAASSADWTVTSDEFAQVLDVAGFSRDAFDVALAGDDWDAAENATLTAFSQFIGNAEADVAGIGMEEIRFAMLVLASGGAPEYLRFPISPSLFAILQANAEKLTSENALAAMQEQFDIGSDELVEEESSPVVFGASLINFPRILKRTRTIPKFAPVSSHSYR